MYELRKYRENIEAMYQEMGGVKPATPTKTTPEPALKTKLQKMEDSEEEAPGNQRAHAPPVLNYLPFSPQLVEVIPSMSEAEDGHGNAATLMSNHGNTAAVSPAPSAPSSPSEGELQIDDSAWRRRDKSPAKPRSNGTPSSEAKGFMSVGRRTQNSLQSVLDTVELSPMIPSSLSPATPLSLQGARGGGGTGSGMRGKKRGLAGVVSILSKRLALSGDEPEADYEEGNHTLFSRCYDDQGKTAIAEIDPEPKRPVRKVSHREREREGGREREELVEISCLDVQVKKPGDKDTEPSPKKVARGQSLKPSLGTPEPSHSPSPHPLLPPPPSQPTLQVPPATVRMEASPRKEKPRASSAGEWVLTARREW